MHVAWTILLDWISKYMYINYPARLHGLACMPWDDFVHKINQHVNTIHTNIIQYLPNHKHNIHEVYSSIKHESQD